MNRLRAASFIVAWLLMTCSDAPDEQRSVHTPGARWVMEPRELALGEIAWADRVIVTPAHAVPHPFEAPREPGGIEILEIEALSAQSGPGYAVHRTRLKVRARAVGTFAWPGAEIPVSGRDGTQTTLQLPELRVEVASVLPEFADRSAPFGLRRPETASSGLGDLRAALAGALLALTAVGLVSLARRKPLRADRKSAPEPSQAAWPWQLAGDAFVQLERGADVEPLAAAHALAAALRHYMGQRYGADCAARTAEELRAAEPPFVARSAWPEFARLVGELDQLRFRPALEVDTLTREALPAWLADARAMIAATVPPEHRP